ncbi:helix-turn-helix transcriptional regulator [Uruburuella testudinis]|uniref:Helix-turn-helix transcriptional regulator n=1 Tax=Uruburuella testudinis TaxID=1282863 RepID=A0ABY4DTW9_9NEIS|nr:helix-turn-helix transcriptional regulator [Uruburuella testudinis]UOO82125.1 helix-turn-helix transcriptional regulator [Uruburuella testudinis]
MKRQRLSLQAADVGLPEVGSRRGGLSQQEVAVLSGVSTRWLARLEQGLFKEDDVELLRRVLNTLCFNAEEQDALLRQAGWQPQSWGEVPQQQLQKYLQKLLDGIDHPAYVVDHLWNRVCWNKSAARLFTHWLGKQVQHTSFIDYLLLDPHSRLFIQNWEKHVVLWLGRFFNNIRPYQDHESVVQFVDEHCRISPVFERLCNKRRHKRTSKIGLRYVFHTAKGDRAFGRMSFPVPDTPGWEMVVWLPAADKKTAPAPAPEKYADAPQGGQEPPSIAGDGLP